MKQLLTFLLVFSLAVLGFGQIPQPPGLTRTQADSRYQRSVNNGRWRLCGPFFGGFQDNIFNTEGIANGGYTFAVTGVTTWPTNGSTYTNNGQTFKIIASNSGASKVFAYCQTSGIPGAIGTLTKSSGTGDATVAFTSFVVGTGQNVCTDRVTWTQPFTVVDPMLLVGNGSFQNSGLFAGPGNPLNVKMTLEYQGNRLPIVLPGAMSTQLPTNIQAGANTTVGTGANSIYQQLASTALILPGCTLFFTTANAYAIVRSVPDSTHVILWTPINSTTSEVVSVTTWPGASYTIPDGGLVWSSHIMGITLVGGTTYATATYQSAGATGLISKVLSYSSVSSQRSSDPVWGGTTDGGDYTNVASLLPGNTVAGAYYFCPFAIVGRQIGAPAPVVLLIGDSIAWGNGNNPFQGVIGTALAGAGIYCFDGGLGGITALNWSRFAGPLMSMSQYCDSVAVMVGTNDFNSSMTVAQVQASMLLMAQELTAAGASITFASIPPRAASSSDSYTTYSGQTPVSYQYDIQAMNNLWRDKSVNGMNSYVGANLGTTGSVSGFFMDIDQYIEKSSTGAAPNFTATTVTFAISAPSTPPSSLSTYRDANSNTFTIGPSHSGETILYTTVLSPGTVPASGTLTRVSGTGDPTVTFSSRTISSANQMMFGTGGYWIVNGTTNWPTSDGIHLTTNLNAGAAQFITGAGSPFALINNNVTGSIHP